MTKKELFYRLYLVTEILFIRGNNFAYKLQRKLGELTRR